MSLSTIAASTCERAESVTGVAIAASSVSAGASPVRRNDWRGLAFPAFCSDAAKGPSPSRAVSPSIEAARPAAPLSPGLTPIHRIRAGRIHASQGFDLPRVTYLLWEGVTRLGKIRSRAEAALSCGRH